MIDGIDVLTIQTVLAEVGPDWSAWKTEQHWASWLNREFPASVRDGC
jgi:hypothetical protein